MRGRLGIAVVASIAVLALSACDAPQSASRFGVNGSGNDTAAQMMKAAGFKWVRFFVHWNTMEPSGPSLDAGAVGGLNNEINVWSNRGFSVDIVITRDVPRWAWDTHQNSGPCANANDQSRPKDETVYHDFMFAMAHTFGDRVGAWELWNEPEYGCRFPGSPGDFRRLILGPGYDGVKQAQPKAIVLGPAIADVQTGVLDDWYTYAANGHRYLKRPVAAVNVHQYGSVSDVEAAMNTAHGYHRCMQDGSYCVGTYWLTEFGFQEGQSPVGKAPQIYQHCIDQSDCQKAFYFSSDYDGLQGQSFGLLDASEQPRQKYGDLKNFLLSKEPPLP